VAARGGPNLTLVAEVGHGDDPAAHATQVQLHQPAAVDSVAERVPVAGGRIEGKSGDRHIAHD